jgi:hypothetical protein
MPESLSLLSVVPQTHTSVLWPAATVCCCGRVYLQAGQWYAGRDAKCAQLGVSIWQASCFASVVLLSLMNWLQAGQQRAVPQIKVTQVSSGL